jgi:hypothetical protein
VGLLHHVDTLDDFTTSLGRLIDDYIHASVELEAARDALSRATAALNDALELPIPNA